MSSQKREHTALGQQMPDDRVHIQKLTLTIRLTLHTHQDPSPPGKPAHPTPKRHRLFQQSPRSSRSGRHPGRGDYFGVTQVVMSQCTTSTPSVSTMLTDTVTSVPVVQKVRSWPAGSATVRRRA